MSLSLQCFLEHYRCMGSFSSISMLTPNFRLVQEIEVSNNSIFSLLSLFELVETQFLWHSLAGVSALKPGKAQAEEREHKV